MATANIAAAVALPTAPLTFSTTYAAPTGKTITVNAGGDLQAAINSALLGDTIVLQAGATFTGPFTLPNKTSGTGWIYIQSSAYSSLPAPGTRVAISDAANMPKLVVAATVGRIIQTANNAHHYRFVGIEAKPVAGNYVSSLIQIGNGDASPATLPNNIVFDRCYIHGDATVGTRRGVAMDGAYIAVIDSYVSDFKEVGSDTQAVWAYNTSGPLKIVNNFLEAAGENVMFGGADSKAASLVPADIEIRNNYFFKPLSWVGSSWQVKNLLEFKVGKRVLVTGNRFENVWPAAQAGWAMTVSPRNQDGGAPWSVTEDIAITANIWINLGQGLRVGGTDDNFTSLRTTRVLLRDNLIQVTGVGNADGRLFSVLGGPTDLTIDHNTAFTQGANSVSMFAENTPPADRFTFTNNIVSNGLYGFKGTGSGDGLSTLNMHFTNYAFSKNAVIGGTVANYPAGNYFPAAASAVQFLNFAGGDYRLASSSPYRSQATDGLDIGANITLVGGVPTGAPVAVAPQPPVSLVVN
jgi:hypothetical protein